MRGKTARRLRHIAKNMKPDAKWAEYKISRFEKIKMIDGMPTTFHLSHVELVDTCQRYQYQKLKQYWHRAKNNNILGV